ncbi:MAG: hypothetical protein JST92_21610, partial [Deltaproteobacteria bacterium]|nr:hypothetical protein [Deltaproteobacteria bacterium]
MSDPAIRIPLRLKLFAVVGTAAAVFVVLITASAILERRTALQLSDIQERYLPRIQLGPQLEGHFSRLTRSFQDAVAARDVELLNVSREERDGFVSTLNAAKGAVPPA